MHQPSKWWTGLIAVAVLWLVAIGFKTTSVEEDIAPRARAAVAAAAPDTAAALKVSVAGRDVRIEGPEFGPDQSDRLDEAAAVDGVRLVDGSYDKLPTPKPYAFRAARNATQLVLEGGVPTPAARDALLKAARAASAGEVVDRLGYALGAPADFAAIAGHGLAQAGKLNGGTFSLADKAYSIAGAAASSDIYEAAIAATRQLPGGAVLDKVAILPPEAKPFIWSAVRDGKSVVMSGVVPTDEIRRALEAAAAKASPGTPVMHHMQIARGAPAGDFNAYTAYALAELARLTTGRVIISDATYTIAGEAPSSAAYDEAMAAIGKLPAGLTLAKADILPPEIKPYRWSAEFDGTGLGLSGLAPSTAAREAILGAASGQFDGKPIKGQIGIARGAPDGDVAKVGAGLLQQLARLAKGRAEINDTKVSISGVGLANVTGASVRETLAGALPAPFALAAVDVRDGPVSPYAFALQKQDGRVRLSGYVPDDAARRDLVGAANAAFVTETVEDGLKIADGAPNDFVKSLKATFPALARLWSGSLTAKDATISIDALAIYDKSAEQVRKELADAAGDLKLDAVRIGVKPESPPLPVAECQPAFEGLLAKGRIRFSTGSAELSRESLALLDHIVDVAQRCKEAEIAIEGHTDNVGNEEDNMDLSKRRAAAVVSYISEAGIDTSRMTSEGYGQTKPVVTNDTPEGRAQNRRIEFVVK
ncbi:OmpA family protein [Bradyrhizobium sp. 83012]|uniref:OmpA family protein n=1 Tax=Bradyrhizobium aeschynomenes TaxID=2734909 RepID=A0ABX2CKC1_9BRAD|nr:OmpA family protein [Bradyrhizobium aeschynomenes]NPU68631.1 OmpA family protein [Bradyrhizobium aeschynomenes]